MKYLKYLLYIILGIGVIYLLLCLAGPKNLDVSKSVEIAAPAPIVFNLANNVRDLERWNEWSKTDTTVKTTFNDIAEGVGSASSWTSLNSGNGSQKIIESTPYSLVRTQLNFEGWSGDNFSQINISELGNQSNVSWTFEGTNLPFLFRGFALITGMKGLMGDNYEKGLGYLKNIAEKRAQGNYFGYQINELDLAEKHFVMNRQIVEKSNAQQFYTNNLGTLFAKVQKAGIEMDGLPCKLFFKWEEDQTTTDMAAAIPIAEPVAIKGSASYSIEAQRAVVLDFYGDYDKIDAGHKAIGRYMKDRQLLENPPVIEENVTDPESEKDPKKWLTKITYYFSDSQG